jgi:hypothetical protein
MSGSISVGPLAPLVSHTTTPLHLPAQPVHARGPGPNGATFRSLLAGSPAPAAAAAPSPCVDAFGPSRVAGLAPAARALPVAPGPQATGRTLASADLSMAAWTAPSAGPMSAVAASAVQVDAVQPVAHASFPAARRLQSSFP